MNKFLLCFSSAFPLISVGTLLLTFVMTGCAGTGRPFVSDARLQALEHNRRGVEAEGRGNHALAHSEFTRALQLSSAIDDADDSVVALLNLSRMARREKSLPVAENYMQRALYRVEDAPGRKGDVAVEKTLLLLAQGQLEAAETWAQRSLELSAAANRAACFNLLARVQLQRGDSVGAEKSAHSALASLNGEDDRVEAANAYRLLGELSMVHGRNHEAADSLKVALKHDKEAGLSQRIATDLRLLAQLATNSGDNGAGIVYLRRAFEVSVNGGDIEAALSDLSQLADLCRETGDIAQAEALENQRLELSGLNNEAETQ